MNPNHALMSRIHAELIDGYDEELELEIEDQFVDDLSAPDEVTQERLREDRRVYFRELFRLQGELVKLQDWVVTTGHKVVILFEGRDAAGKGGVIKRITQRLNPACAALWPCPHPTTANARSGTSSATCPTCLRAAKLCCSTAAGTTAPGWKR